MKPSCLRKQAERLEKVVSHATISLGAGPEEERDLQRIFNYDYTSILVNRSCKTPPPNPFNARGSFISFPALENLAPSIPSRNCWPLPRLPDRPAIITGPIRLNTEESDLNLLSTSQTITAAERILLRLPENMKRRLQDCLFSLLGMDLRRRSTTPT